MSGPPDMGGGSGGMPGAPDRRPGAPARPLRSRWLLAAALVLVALVGVVMWGLLAVHATDATARGFARSDLPGELTADLRPGVWNVYAEGPSTVRRVTVTGPDGAPVAVEPVRGGGAAYDHRGLVARRVASFSLLRSGEQPGVRVRVEGTADVPEATFAVGADDELGSIDLQRWGMVALLVVNLGAALALVVVPGVRYRRLGAASRTAAAGGRGA